MSEATMTVIPNPNKKRVIPTAAPVAPKPVSRAAEALPPSLRVSDMQFAEFSAATYNVWLPVGWRFEETLRPEFWAQTAHKLARQPVTNEPDKSGAVIQVRTRDHNFYAELYVIAVQEKGLRVAVLREPTYFDLKDIPETESNRAQWNAARSGWDIVRKSDGAVVADGANIKSRHDAKDWMEKTLRN